MPAMGLRPRKREWRTFHCRKQETGILDRQVSKFFQPKRLLVSSAHLMASVCCACYQNVARQVDAVATTKRGKPRCLQSPPQHLGSVVEVERAPGRCRGAANCISA